MKNDATFLFTMLEIVMLYPPTYPNDDRMRKLCIRNAINDPEMFMLFHTGLCENCRVNQVQIVIFKR